MDVVSTVVRSVLGPGVCVGARLVLAGSILLLLSGCQPRPAPVGGTLPSPEALAAAVLEAYAARDDARLRDLALTEAEFRARIWPELPASRPERNLTADYVWKDLAQKSEASRRSLVARLGGRRFVLRAVDFAGETTDYKTFSVSRTTELVVVDEDGAEQRLRVFGALLRVDGRAKVFSYVVD
jgi:hypothetical protein